MRHDSDMTPRVRWYRCKRHTPVWTPSYWFINPVADMWCEVWEEHLDVPAH